MNMTDLFVELIVAGSGVAVWMLLLVSGLVDVDWSGLVPGRLASLVVLIPFLSVVYVLGIVVDRVADRLFDLWDDPLRQERFRDSAGYHRARTYVNTHGEAEIIGLFKYHRHRIRICRAWTLNFALLALAAPLFAYRRLSRIDLAIAALLGSLLLALACWGTWKRLAITDYKQRRRSGRML